MKRWALFTAGALLAACSKEKPTPLAVCAKLQASGVPAGCKVGRAATGLGAAASAVFNLPSVLGQTGQVLHFTKESDYTAT